MKESLSPNQNSQNTHNQSFPFTFSQASLQDFTDCPRRFQLLYIQRLAWPAPEVKPSKEYEDHMQRGQAFHKLIHQYFLGISADRLSLSASADPILAEWWRNFQAENPIPYDYAKFPEISLSIPIGRHRLVARYDLVSLGESKLIIFDWKTNKKHSKREWFRDRLQTRVYPYVLITAGSQLNQGKDILPDQIEMIYWFSNFPEASVHFSYNQEQFHKDETFLSDLVNRISNMEEAAFVRTNDHKHCGYCCYRSLCDRGKEAGNWDDMDNFRDLEAIESDDIIIDVDQIAEIEF